MTACKCCGCDPCDCHRARVKHKAVCISMNEQSIHQLNELQNKSGKSKSRIVRDAIDKEYRKFNK